MSWDMASDNRHEFLGAFDRLHREMRLRFADTGLGFADCLALAARKRLLSETDRRFPQDVRDLRNFHSHANDLSVRRLLEVRYDAALIARLSQIADRFAARTPGRPFMVRWEKVLHTTLDEPAVPLATRLLERSLSHAPVMEGGRVVAVFDERVLFAALASRRLPVFDAATTIRNVVGGHLFADVPPARMGIDFVSRQVSLYDLRRQLDEHAKDKDRITLAIVTENGNPTERPLGLLTIWDIPQVD